MVYRISTLKTGLLICLGFSVVVAPCAGAQTELAAQRTMTAIPMQADERIVLDGRIDESVWQRAQPATEFIQQDPDFGAPATERTEVRIVFDRENLYMAVICYDSEPDRLLGYERRRDQSLLSDDRFMWTIDTYLNARSGYYFEINPSGLMGDELLGIGQQGNRQWDGLWTANVRRSEIGWTAEIELPFRTLNFDPNISAWGINFQRTVRRKNEESLWTGHARNQGLRRMSNAGLLLGINGVSQGRGLELKPYALASALSAPGRGLAGSTAKREVGLDVFFSPTPSLRANLTVNTDFAQVEVDQRQVNLTRFSLLFPEKRDFFLEGSGFLDFGSVTQEFVNNDVRVDPFFSRRIGLNSLGEPQPIDFGTKLTGQIGRQDIGVLHVRTAHEPAAAGQAEMISEDFTVLRMKRRVLAQSYVGGLFTRRQERATGAAAQHTSGVDFRLATSTFRGSKNLVVGGFLLNATNPLDTGGNNSFGLMADYNNDPVRYQFSFREVQDHFDPAIGFVGRRGFRRYNPELSFWPRPPQNRWIRRFSFLARMDLQNDSNNNVLQRDFELNVFGLELHSQDTFSIVVSPTHERLDSDFRIHRDVTLTAGTEYDYTRYQFTFSSANRRVLALRSIVGIGEFYSGTRRQVDLSLTYRARPGLIVYASADLNQIDLPEGKFDTQIFRLTGETQFSPWLALVNNVQYDSVSRVLGWQGRFRWILKPGNDFYVVYMHNFLDDPRQGLLTLDRRASAKAIYTHRF
jgi:hypothetical protein